ncbi:sugar ABC transporter ATP-binding protein [Lichenifustis flavocetrariae]|uniref:Sugar ABC transporter ATP-binding protein n=1 Tax=Lichenifustis flavocetrariae TaxID=2949735 RepID=A0AA41YXT6_9HYPH|nr:sugar ABC transporter ATP-binding protein [Lichenifustis flavocetrariae]MCW6508998.1 sugar ABC transporter ATP-binding protein [Lichenifustis flavocetrariae]
MPSDAARSDRAPATGPSGAGKPVSISVVGVRKHFGVTRALDGCNFSACFGEIHAIVGGNGCGKSTLAKILSGVLPADGGRVSVLGHATLTPYEARGIGVATVFQEVLVADECSVVDNLFMGSDGLFTQRLSGAAKLRAADALMRDLAGERVDVQALAGTLPLNLKQWITIGRALLRNPRILILDESSAALDLDSTERLFAKMRALRDGGATVLIVTHRIAELIRISDRATVLRDGRDVGVLEKSEITEHNLLSLMTGRSDHAKPVSSASVEDALHGEVVLRTRGLRIWPESPSLDVDLHRGEILGVAGLDGQGQSEFVRILAGVQAAAAGHPEVRTGDGRFAAIHGLAEATGHGVSYVSGDRKREGIFANLSIFENMLMPLYRLKARAGKIATIDWKALDATFAYEVDNLLIKMGARTNKITSLSGGNQQKVLIGRGFAMNPDIMVLNDPARGIDVGAKAELYRHLSAFAAQGRAVVYMSSEIEEFVGFCSRVIVFRNGGAFDAFRGSALDPAVILAAMFGQTDGRGTRLLTSSQATAAATTVGPIKIREFAPTVRRSAAATAEGPRFGTADRDSRPAIRIVEFQDGHPVEIGPTDGGQR